MKANKTFVGEKATHKQYGFSPPFLFTSHLIPIEIKYFIASLNKNYRYSCQVLCPLNGGNSHIGDFPIRNEAFPLWTKPVKSITNNLSFTP